MSKLILRLCLTLCLSSVPMLASAGGTQTEANGKMAAFDFRGGDPGALFEHLEHDADDFTHDHCVSPSRPGRGHDHDRDHGRDWDHGGDHDRGDRC